MDLAKTRKIACYTAILAVTLAAASLADFSHATNFTWDGEISNSWSESRTVGNIFFPRVISNWEPDGYRNLQLPTSSDHVIFGEFTTYNRMINLNGDRTVNSVEFKNAQNFNLTNGTLLLASGDLTSTSTSPQTLDADVTLQSNGSWNVSGAPVVVNGRIYSSNYLTKRGVESLYLTNNNNFLYKTFVREGALLISNNGSLTNSNGYIGNMPGSTYAAAYVSGANASWVNTESIHVGQVGYGRLDVTFGGTVISSEAIIGKLADSYGNATVSGTNSTWNTDSLLVGDSGYGRLNINSGSTVTSLRTSRVGNELGSTGVVTINGANSTLNSKFLKIGNEGDGTLNIEEGGSVISNHGSVATWDGSSGVATITGANSTWEITDTLSLSMAATWGQGYKGGRSVININNGGVVSNDHGKMSAFNASFAPSTVTVTGAKSAWNNSDTLTVGYGDSGDITTSPATINIGYGGTVSAGNTIYLNSTGDINLLGGTLRTANLEFATDKGINFDRGTLHLTQSTVIDNSNIFDLNVRRLVKGQKLRVDGTTTLQTPLIIDGGKFSTGSIVGFNNIDFQGGSILSGPTFELTQSNFTIGSAGIAGPILNLPYGATIDVTNNASIAADGVLNSSGGTFSAAKLTNSGTIIASGGKTSYFGTEEIGAEFVHNGLEVRTTAGSKSYFSAAVSGSGDFTGPGKVYFLTDYSPGTSTDVIHFGGNVEFMGYGFPEGYGYSILAIDLAGLLSGEFDQLVIAGNAKLAGSLAIDLLDGFLLSPGNEFEILDIAGTLSGQFFGLDEGDLVGNFGGEDLFISYTAGDGNDVSLFTTGIFGDVDSDGDIDGSDFLSLQRGMGVSFNGTDLDAWSANFGTLNTPRLAAATNAVPEPSTGFLFLLGIVALFSRRSVVVK